jgi:NADP-dependent 3-hydroxy acid dehydrogenase YdfG
MRKIALVTGATSGIGEASALKLAGNGFDLIITGRRQDRLEALKKKLEEAGSRVSALCFDVRNEAEVNAVLGNLPQEWNEIDVLVNNAGLAAGLEPLQQGDSSDWNRMIDTNIKGLLYVTRCISPGMIARKK